MKKEHELVTVSPYDDFLKGRFVGIRNILTGWNETKFYSVPNKRKLVKLLRNDGVMCPHSVYRGG